MTESSRQSFEGSVGISLERGCLVRGGREIRLRARTFQVLVYLHDHSGRLVSKEDLFRAVWSDTFVTDDSLTKCVREIRDALGDSDHTLLKTVPRRGFILDARLATVPHTAVRQQSPASDPSNSRTHNLPAPLTSFVGRQRQIADLAQLLQMRRLLTLTGAGGCGKTRLALEVARQVQDDFPDGVWLVDFAPLTESTLVTQTVASVLDVRQTYKSLLETLADQLRQRRLLLVLDNCEHVIDGSAELAETLLRAAPALTVLATSREALGIGGESTWRVPSLTVPSMDQPVAFDALMEYEGIHLLVERARAVDARFTITAENASAVAEVCRRLDGIPLAIELAAARLGVLSIDQVKARLDDRFRLLTAPPRTTVGRQRTLEATLDWSHELLDESERRLVRRLSTFAGGWTLEAAEEVCTGDGIARADILDVMSRLVDKSLVVADDDSHGTRRYRYLETVRQYAWERLQQSGEAAAVRARHFAHFLELGRRAEPQLTKAAQLHWLRQLQLEHDNLRAALEWEFSADRSGHEGLELASRLHWFWMKRAYLSEGRHWLETALARSAAPSAPRRAHGLMALGTITFFLGDFERSQDLLEQSAALARSAGMPSIVALALGIHTMAALERGDGAGAARRAEESLAAARAAGEPYLEGLALSYFAYQAMYAGDIDRAEQLQEQCLGLARERGELWVIGIVLYDLAMLRVVQHRYEDARTLCREGIALGRQFGDRRAIAWCLGVFAGADAAEGRALRAARLRGAMEGQLDSIGAPAQPTFNMLIGDRYFGLVQSELGPSAYEQAVAEGRAMPLPQAIEYAIEGKGDQQLTV